MNVLFGIAIAVILVGVALGRYPVLRMNRATIALVGAVGLVLLGAIRLEEAYAAVDLDTIVLLFAMMILNANLRIAGFFHLIGSNLVRWAHSPRRLLWSIIFASGILSALFLNDTIVLMFTPLVLEVTLALKRHPLPYLIALATAANIGSVATITGNPQNMLIGMSSGISYLEFSAALAPVALGGLVICGLVVQVVYRSEFSGDLSQTVPRERRRTYRPLLLKSILATAGMLAAFVAGVPIPLAALSAAAFLLVTRRLKPGRVFREVDWGLLVFFSGLFVVTGAIETSGLSTALFEVLRPIVGGGIPQLAGAAVVLSNVISNVPAVLLFRPVMAGLEDPQQSWLVLAMATTLAGNLTLLGSVANLIVAEIAQSAGVPVRFGEYLRAGVPITLLSLLLGVLWLSLS